jgi:hypothetical protein
VVTLGLEDGGAGLELEVCWLEPEVCWLELDGAAELIVLLDDAVRVEELRVELCDEL